MDSAVDRGCSMVTALRLCAAASIGVWLAASAIAADARKTPDGARPDPRLDQRISVSVAYDSLQELCAKLGALSAPTDPAQAGAGEADGRPQRAAPTGETNAAPASSASPRDQEIARPISVEITVDPAIKEHKVVVRVKDQPLREVMRQIAVLFDFTWMQGPQEHPRYHLMQNSARAKLPADLRKRFVAEKESRYRQVFKDVLRALRATPDELRELAKTDPNAVALAVYNAEGYAALTALDEASADAVLGGSALVLPFGALSSDAQAKVMERVQRLESGDEAAGRETDRPWEQAQIRFERREQPSAISITIDMPQRDGTQRRTSFTLGWFTPEPPWSRFARVLARVEDLNLSRANEAVQKLETLEAEYGINIVDKADRQASDAVPEWARSKAVVEAPKASAQHVSIGTFPPTLPLLLRTAAERLDINLVADCFWTHRDTGTRFAGWTYPLIRDADRNYYVDTNPEYTLYRICGQRGRGWIKDGGFFRVRNLLWFVDDPEEVPASVLRQWMRRTDHEKHAAPEDYVYLATSLSQRHAENIALTDYWDGTSEPTIIDHARAVSYAAGYYAMKLYGLLPPGLRERAQTAGIDVNTELPEDPLRMVEKLLTEDRSYNNQPLIDRLTPEQLSNLRLWIGRREAEMSPDDTGGREGVHEHSFCVELWSGTTPTWADQWAKGCVWAGSYWTHQTQDPDKVGKLAEPYATIESERQRKGK